MYILYRQLLVPAKQIQTIMIMNPLRMVNHPVNMITKQLLLSLHVRVLASKWRCANECSSNGNMMSNRHTAEVWLCVSIQLGILTTQFETKQRHKKKTTQKAATANPIGPPSPPSQTSAQPTTHAHTSHRQLASPAHPSRARPYNKIPKTKSHRKET